MTLATAALALSLALGQAAPAAPAPAGPALTLTDAIRRATEANLDLKVARARLDQARSQVGQAWAGYLPQVTAGATWTHNSDAAAITLPTGYYVRDLGALQGPPAGGSVEGSPTNFALRPSGSITADIQKQDQLGAQVQANQALLAPPLWFTIRGAGQAAAASEQGVEGARRTVQFISARYKTAHRIIGAISRGSALPSRMTAPTSVVSAKATASKTWNTASPAAGGVCITRLAMRPAKSFSNQPTDWRSTWRIARQRNRVP